MLEENLTTSEKTKEEKDEVREFVNLVEQRKKREALVLYRKMTRQKQERVKRDYEVYLKVAQMQF